MEDTKKEIEKEAEEPLTKDEKDENTNAHEKKEVEIAYTIADLANMILDMHETLKGISAEKREEQGGAKAVIEDEKGVTDNDKFKEKRKYSY